MNRNWLTAVKKEITLVAAEQAHIPGKGLALTHRGLIVDSFFIGS
jgi:hypothetical protein